MALRITHTNNSSGHDGTYVYRSTSPMDPQALPAPVADAPPVGLGETFEYIDNDPPASGNVYYRTQDHESEQVSLISDEVVISTGEPHKYWRLYVTDTNSTDTYSAAAANIQFRKAIGVSETHSGSGAASASTTLNFNYEASEAFDGDISTSWFPDSGAALPQWIKFEFTEPVACKEFYYQAGNDSNRAARSPIDFIIQSSDDGSSWTDELLVTGEPAWSVGESRVYRL